jgi:hypothetical protein
MPADVDALIDAYCDAWSTPLPVERERILRSVLADDAMYCDPRCAPMGIDALLGYIAQLHASRPGARIVRTSAVDTHHEVARFAWQVRLPDGRALAESLDVVTLADDNAAIQRIVGFFGPLGPAMDAT